MTPIPASGRRRRVLFVAEAVTLAHIGRLVVLASALDPDQFEVVFAVDPRGRRFLPADASWVVRDISSLDSAEFVRRLARGQRVYTVDDLSRYVEDDLALIDDTAPDAIVGDFRLSLSVSARLRKRPYVTVTNAYWSPFAAKRRLPMPVLPVTRLLGPRVAQIFFNFASPIGAMYHAVPLNTVRSRYGLPKLEYDIRKIYTDGDVTAYADIPELIPTDKLPANHHFIGPVLWSPPVVRPDWWDKLPTGRPIVYVTLGSSGHQENLLAALDALAEERCTVIAATAGLRVKPAVAQRIHVADYLPGMEAARRSRLVICNGGSPTSHQALAMGVPVLGIASNMDQFLNMEAVAEAGAGRVLRGDRAGAVAVQAAVREILSEPRYAQSAREVSEWFERYPCGPRFVDTLRALA